jgi:hypothetical protein
MVTILRVMLGDTEEDESKRTYTDDRLTDLVLLGAFQVSCELTFGQDFAVDIEKKTISPDPTAAATRDDSFINLACIKAACTVDRASAGVAAARAIAARDGNSAVDLRGVSSAKIELLKRGWCAVYAEEKKEYKMGRCRVAGALVLTPFRLYAGGTGYQPILRE